MIVLTYALNSLAWSGLGLAAGIVMTQVACDVGAFISGRWHHGDDT